MRSDFSFERSLFPWNVDHVMQLLSLHAGLAEYIGPSMQSEQKQLSWVLHTHFQSYHFSISKRKALLLVVNLSITSSLTISISSVNHLY